MQRPIIIDLEASGFGPDSYPIEVGVVMSDGERYCSLIRPKEDWTHWSMEAAAYHNIPRQHLHKYGLPAEVIAAELNRLLAGKTVYTDGWVVDYSWMIKLFYRAGLPMQFKISALEMILSEPQMTIWHEQKDKLVKELKLKRHRASHDALLIQETYVRTQQLTARKPAPLLVKKDQQTAELVSESYLDADAYLPEDDSKRSLNC